MGLEGHYCLRTLTVGKNHQFGSILETDNIRTRLKRGVEKKPAKCESDSHTEGSIQTFSAITLFSMSMLMSVCQRPSFAGSRPIGYPEMITEAAVGLADRFGTANGTTERLPVEALGDRELVDRLSKLPKDKQPFWLLNWQALEENRKRPQTYPQRPNSFLSNNMNSNQNVETSSQAGTADRFGGIESSGTSGGSGSTGNPEKVSSSSTSNSIGNVGNASGTSGSLGSADGLLSSSTAAPSVVSSTNSYNNQGEKSINEKQKKNNYFY
ncbi:hypothetical protein EVAR_83049_1 [Eumeta japonica]|uniref:Uncharacterized protein n=1 Tax=Eumeta variegata TaxID=151549 RepID=A0A4C1VND3_EUMVA|nr:hypothetical protein EVAR_83049_1 [Eumeta japonica]